jgi:hypothetical protein
MGILGGRDHAGRLVQQDVGAGADLPNWPPVNRHLIFGGVNARAQRLHNAAIDRHAAFAN